MEEQILSKEEMEKREILARYRSLLRTAKEKLNEDDKKLIRRAFNLALDAHKNVRRKSGELYIFHPLAVAEIVAKEIGLGATSIAAAVIHDVVEDTDYTLEDIERLFGDKIARIIDGLTKISGILDQNVSIQAENFRKMLLTLSEDVRVILIKLADRLHNMRTLDHMSAHKQVKIASETLYIYAPLAHRLGLYTIKTELEDLGLKYTEPQVFKDIEDRLQESKKERIRYINKFVAPIKKVLNEQDFDYEIKGRPKSIFSIRNKMVKQGVSFDEVYDKFAIRIIIDTPIEREKSECWKVYSIITDFYKPNPDRLRDWISNPRANGYESLHTTVMGPEGHWVEVQIRTKRMDEVAEVGYAAHWRYKNDGKTKDSRLDDWIDRIREMLEKVESNAVDFIDDFKLNLFADEVFVFTPKGDLMTLPMGATALDFAFEIHSEIGATCLGAKVNAKLVPLSHVLRSGDQVEIITSAKQKPKENWLNFVVTAKAKAKIKASLKDEKKTIADEGKEILERKLKHLKIQLNSKIETELIKYFNTQTSQDLYYQFGTGVLTNQRLKKFVADRQGGIYQYIKNKLIRRTPSVPVQALIDKRSKDQVLVFGPEDERLDYTLSKCCDPIPGDDVFGFVTINEGIKVHKTNCPNALRLQSNFAYRILSARWIGSDKEGFATVLLLKGIDKPGIVNEITRIISNDMSVNIRSLNISGQDGIFEGRITVLVYDKLHLEELITNLKEIEELRSVERVNKT